MDPSRIRGPLNNSRLKQGDNAAYQAVNSLIDIGQQLVDSLAKKLDASALIDLTKQVTGLLSYRNGGVFTKTYIPTLFEIANIDVSAGYITTYFRVGDFVIVSGKVTIDPTAAGGTLTQLELSLPIPSYFLHEEQCSGVIAGNSFSATSGFGGIVKANPADGNAVLEFYANNATDHDVRFYFSYQVIQQP